MVDGVDHASGTIGRAECPLGRSAGAVPQQDIAAFLLRESPDDVIVEIDTDGAGEP